MNDHESESKARAKARTERMQMRFTTLHDETDPWPVFGAEALSLVSQITRQVWSLGRQPVPEFPRSRMPVRFVPFDTE